MWLTFEAAAAVARDLLSRDLDSLLDVHRGRLEDLVGFFCEGGSDSPFAHACGHDARAATADGTAAASVAERKAAAAQSASAAIERRAQLDAAALSAQPGCEVPQIRSCTGGARLPDLERLAPHREERLRRPSVGSFLSGMREPVLFLALA
mmetsp:Transcript_37941/g.89154  ORF Transcript_37941/g.89154 Transcript_37941/m.89154 type:complete len:151 (-) Transcript_37941:283-735(-)